MATTTNYGWTTPDDTALVKDGASAIRTLGSSVDTTTKNLNPSTTLGDIEYRSSTSNVNTRLGIGSTSQVLTVTGGVPVWATPGGVALVGCSLVENATNQSVPTGTWTALTYTAEVWDTDAFHSNTVNTSRITIPAGKSGKYLVSALIQFATITALGLPKMKLYKNGSDFKWMDQVIGTENPVLNSAIQVTLTAGDYIELFAYHDGGSNKDCYKSDNYPGFSVYYLGA